MTPQQKAEELFPIEIRMHQPGDKPEDINSNNRSIFMKGCDFVRKSWMPQFQYEQAVVGDEKYWMAWIDAIPGMVVSGETKEQAFEELMISLKVKWAYDNNIQLQELKSQQ